MSILPEELNLILYDCFGTEPNTIRLKHYRSNRCIGLNDVIIPYHQWDKLKEIIDVFIEDK